MKVEFDPDKDAVKRRKHGRSLADAALMDFDTAAYAPDRRHAYGEERFQAHGLIDGRLHVLAFTMRSDAAASNFAAKGKHERGEALWKKRRIRMTMTTTRN